MTLMRRCSWLGKNPDPIYIEYHDHEWGRRISDDRRLFERISLEGMQAGLSWITVLKKREAFREVFYDFDIDKVAAFETERAIPKLLQNVKLIRSDKKLRSIIHNAKIVQGMQKNGESFANFLWNFAPDDPFKYANGAPQPKSDESEAMSKALKKRGFLFVGPVICYALMQAVGMVQDHLEECAYHKMELGELL